MIYFIQQGEDGPIKIGRSENIERRLATLQIGNAGRLRILGAIPGENELHYHFADLAIRGEWYEPGERLTAFIDRYAQEPDPGWSDISHAAERQRQAKKAQEQEIAQGLACQEGWRAREYQKRLSNIKLER